MSQIPFFDTSSIPPSATTVDNHHSNATVCINTRDKLLRLAELGPNNHGHNSNKNNKRHLFKTRIPNTSSSLTPSSKSSSRNKSPNLDLSFTENIEHLVNNKNNKDGRKSAFGDINYCSRQQQKQNVAVPQLSINKSSSFDHTSTTKHRHYNSDSSSQEPIIHPFNNTSVLNDYPSNQKYPFATTEITNPESRIPRCNGHPNHQQSISNNSKANNNNNQVQFPDLYSKYKEFRQKNMDHLSNDSKPLLRMHSDYSSRSSMISTATLKSNNVTFIPICDQRMVTNHHQMNVPEKIEMSRFHNLSSNEEKSDLFVKSVHDFNHYSMKEKNPHPNETSSNGNHQRKHVISSEMNITASISDSNKDRILSHLNNVFSHMNAFIMDEENYTNSPKRILTKETLFPKNDLFNCDNQADTTGQLNNHDDLLEDLFLADSQKNSVFTIHNSSFSQKNNFDKQPDNSHQSTTTTATNKSSSCDNLDDIKFKKSIDKFKSENDLNKNDISGLSHLEEDNSSEHDSVINRFRKKFSIRGRSAQSLKTPISSNRTMNNQSSNISDQDQRSLPKIFDSSQSLTGTKIDINQNTIDMEDPKYLIILSEKLSPPSEARKFTINRKSLRKMSRKHARLKRSHTQPFDNQIIANASDDVSGSEHYEESKHCNKLGNLLINHEDHDLFGVNNSSISPTNDVLDESHNNVIYAEAIFDYLGSDNEELSFRAGDLLEVTDTSHKQWWWGAIKTNDETRYGWFPATYVRLKVSQEESIENVEQIDEDNMSTANQQMRTSQISKLNSEQVRANIIQEIINTERNFGKNLKDVIDGYLKPCRDRKDMFDETRISTIFGNITELYEFQSKFLAKLEQCINETDLSQSQIGNCFLQNEKGFSVYSEFCKNHPLATSELQDLYTDHKYVIFFEGCRLLQNMIDISLDGFLLTPIQKICKYPLQLAELLKYTKPDHCDHAPVQEAYKCMQRVAQMVNERKSRFESLEKLLSIQESFENWEGPPLLDTCSLLVHSGEISRVTRSTWSKEMTLFLFDHLLVLAKKDTRILKKRTYLFKTRIDLDQIDPIIPLDDNIRDINLNVFTKNAFKFYYRIKQKWYLFQAKSPEDKEQWLNAFQEERRRTKEDEEQGFTVTEQDKKSALLAHQNNLKPKKPKARKPYTKTKKPDTVIAEIPLAPLKGQFEIDRNRAGSLPSYIHQDKHLINLYKNRQFTFHKKTGGNGSGAIGGGGRSNWFQLGSTKKNRMKRNLK